MKILYSILESPFPPDFHSLYAELGIVEERFSAARNLHRALQKQAPDFFVGEFVYGWGNDYAGATVSNLDVTLRTLECTAPKAKTIVFVQPRQEAHIGKLLALFQVHAVLKFPVGEDAMRAALKNPEEDRHRDG